MTRIAYTDPAPGERYLADKKVVQQVIRSAVPDLELLTFQTRHGPNMTKGIPYCARHSRTDLLILSVEEGLISEALRETFVAVVLPWLANRIAGLRLRNASSNWPGVVVALDGAFVEAACSAGALFPSIAEVRRRMNVASRIAAIPA